MLGRTGLRVSVLGFGCGNVGGLIVRGSEDERERAVARALELGVTYFDTAPGYGNGRSEANLGRALRSLGADVVVGTKFTVGDAAPEAMPEAVAQSLEASLQRLRRERVDLLQLHHRIGPKTQGRALSPRTLLDALVPALDKLVEQGKIGHYGITALGSTESLLEVIDSGAFATAQVCFNLLNPTAAHQAPAGFPAQDFGGLLLRASERGMGTIVIRSLAAGALSGALERHALAAPAVAPIATGPDYTTDVKRCAALQPLIDEGHASTLVEAALRFPLACPAVSTVLVGYSSLEQIEVAARSVENGPLDPAALARLTEIWAELGAGTGAD